MTEATHWLRGPGFPSGMHSSVRPSSATANLTPHGCLVPECCPWVASALKYRLPYYGVLFSYVGRYDQFWI
jgi:hypothetical protein